MLVPDPLGLAPEGAPAHALELRDRLMATLGVDAAAFRKSGLSPAGRRLPPRRMHDQRVRLAAAMHADGSASCADIARALGVDGNAVERWVWEGTRVGGASATGIRQSAIGLSPRPSALWPRPLPVEAA